MFAVHHAGAHVGLAQLASADRRRTEPARARRLTCCEVVRRMRLRRAPVRRLCPCPCPLPHAGAASASAAATASARRRPIVAGQMRHKSAPLLCISVRVMYLRLSLIWSLRSSCGITGRVESLKLLLIVDESEKSSLLWAGGYQRCPAFFPRKGTKNAWYQP